MSLSVCPRPTLAAPLDAAAPVRRDAKVDPRRYAVIQPANGKSGSVGDRARGRHGLAVKKLVIKMEGAKADDDANGVAGM